MSDLSRAKQKLKEGADWRGTVTVEIGGDEMELTVRQLRDPELEEVMGLIDRSELESLRDDYPMEKVEELQELREQDELTDDEQERVEELEDDIREEGTNLFDILSSDTFEGIRRAAIYGVEPDDDDLQHAFRERAHEIETEYGVKVKKPDDVKPALDDEWEETVRNATNFTSFQIGMTVLTETAGDEGN